KGGAGFLASEYTEASRLTTGPYPSMLTAYDARAIPYWRTLADAVHEHDCRWIVELFSPGVHDHGRLWIDDWHPVYGASRATSPVWNEIPAVLDHQQLAEMRGDFGISAGHA